MKHFILEKICFWANVFFNPALYGELQTLKPQDIYCYRQSKVRIC